MSFPRYAKYKDSGVEWLGEVPEHWGVGRVRWLTRRYSGGTPEKTNLAYWEDGAIPWLNSGAVNDRLIEKPSTYITDEGFANSSAKWIPKGALVVALAGQGKTKGMVAQLAIRSTCNQSMAALVPDAQIEARFLFWWLDSNYQNIRNMAGGDLRDGLNLELLGNIPCPLAPLPEQKDIAIFLDKETAKLDELVGEQQRLMELLKEKRQAVISHAVTKGLNPDAPMKPSGIEWLGDVPAHWEVRRVKSVSSFITSGPRGWSERVGDHGSLFVQSGDLNDALGIDFAASKRVQVDDDAEAVRTLLRDGDVVVCITGAKTGNVGLCSVAPEPAYINQHLCLIRPIAEVLPMFLAVILKSSLGQTYFDFSQYGLKQGLSLGDVKEAPVLLPALAEQRVIVGAIEDEAAKIDALTAEATRAISLLQERRTALISAAVTGQIDVRAVAERQSA